MKKVILLLLAAFLLGGVSYSQDVIGPKKKTHQTSSGKQNTTPPKKNQNGKERNNDIVDRFRVNREEEYRRRRLAEEQRRREEESRQSQENLRRKLEEEKRKYTGAINGHEYVDLGLPSKKKWASSNIGAFSPSGVGTYFSWGEISSKPNYSKKNSLTKGKNLKALRKSGIIGYTGKLTESNDVAYAKWGGSWRMPTKKEIEELKDLCTWTWITDGGQSGYKVTGPNGQSIFLPAGGWYEDGKTVLLGKWGAYWSANAYDDKDNAYTLSFSSDGSIYAVWNFRFEGRTVRPISD